MKHATWIVTLSLAVVMAFATAASAKPKKPKSCDSTAVADAKTAIEAACPCAGKTDAAGAVVPWKNHGQYVKCVTQATRDAGKTAGLSKQCLNDVKPCAANSACGKSGRAVACVVTTGVCLDDPTPGDAVAEGACDTNADCAQSTCQVAGSTAACAELGGSAVGVECCQ